MNVGTRSTARRMWALPGAVLTARPRFMAVDGQLVQADQAPTHVNMPCPSYLIEHDRGLVLFDTGVSPKGLQDPETYFPAIAHEFDLQCRPELGVDRQITGLGYRLDHVTYVIPSHLHFDHAGGLYLFAGATFIIGAGEMGFAYESDAASGRPYFLLEDLRPTRSFRWVEIAGDLDLFGDGSIMLLSSPGHTPGSLALFVRLPNRNFILTGDACHFPAEVELGIARGGFDSIAATRSLRRLALLQETWDAHLWIAHDMDHWHAWPHAPEQID
jgi:N-acyl homoserine lactone hydrolase